jgi:site-specific DNA recombinase
MPGGKPGSGWCARANRRMVCNMVTMPTAAVLLARISDARDGDEHGVAGQLSDLRAFAGRLGWGIGPAETHHIVENDTSAYQRRTVVLPDGSRALRTNRPGYRRALQMLASGQADGLLAIDLDRACRDPRDLEDLIDVVEGRQPRIPVDSLTGSLRLATDADVAMARVMVAMANKSSRDTARRVAGEMRRKAAEGVFSGGTRCYGYEPDMMTLRAGEAGEIVWAAEQVLAGASLRFCCHQMNARGARTTRGQRWATSSLRQLLMRPRLAGIAVYHGEEIGPGKWPPVLDEGTWRALVALLSDPARRTAPGNEPSHLLSGIGECGVCQDGTTVFASGPRVCSRYRCNSGAGHLGRAAEAADEFVGMVVVRRLEQPDAVELLAPRTCAVDGGELHRQAETLRQRLNEQAAAHARGTITTAQLEAGSAILRADLGRAEAALAASVTGSPLDGIAGRRDASEVWDALPLWRKRAALRVLVTPVLMPARGGRQPGGSYFDAASVVFRWAT